MFHRLWQALALTAALLATSQSQAQEAYPAKQIRMVIPAPAGGPLDTLGRHFGQVLSEQLKTVVIIDNRPGGSASIGAGEVARAVPDGGTLLFAPEGVFTVVPNILAKPPYDPVKDFEPISHVSVSPLVLVASPAVPANSLKELLAGGGKGGPWSFGTWGPGTPPHRFAAALARSSGLPLVIVPYKGNAPALQDLLGRHIQMTMLSVPQARELYQKKAIKVLGVTGDRRSELLPDAPTLIEQGWTDPMARMTSWTALVAPAGTPAKVIARLREATALAVKMPSMQKYLLDSGWIPMESTPAQFHDIVKRDMVETGKALRAAGVQPE